MQEIDAKVVALDARREAAKAAGGAGGKADDFGAEVKETQDRINSLQAHVEAKLRTAEAGREALAAVPAAAATPAAEVEAALRKDAAPDATLGRIDDILSKK